MTPDFIVKTRLGAAIFTTDDRKKAVAEANRLRDEFPGCYVTEFIQPPPVERRIWSDRSHLRLVGAA
jgi:hypothetical protein